MYEILVDQTTQLFESFTYFYSYNYEWISLCKKFKKDILSSACDLTIAYTLSKSEINTKKVDIEGFYHCNHHGIPCHQNMFSFCYIYSFHHII